jgi:hypothetical protein
MGPQLPPIPAPSEREREALAVVATYLTRAGTTVASRLLEGDLRWQEAMMMAEVRDQLRRAGTLCLGMAEEPRSTP